MGYKPSLSLRAKRRSLLIGQRHGKEVAAHFAFILRELRTREQPLPVFRLANLQANNTLEDYWSVEELAPLVSGTDPCYWIQVRVLKKTQPLRIAVYLFAFTRPPLPPPANPDLRTLFVNNVACKVFRAGP